MNPRVVVADFDLLSSLGESAASTFRGLLEGRSGIRPFDRLPDDGLSISNAAFVDDLDPTRAKTLLGQMLDRILRRERDRVPTDAQLLLATTNGEIDLLEREILGGGPPGDSRLTALLPKVQECAGTSPPGIVISAACASSTMAIGEAAAMIRSGTTDCAVVVACDHISDFVVAGFGSLGALDPEVARPFDRERRGLSVGEAAGWCLLMSEERARAEGRGFRGEILGWGGSSDAEHVTAPSKQGRGLTAAIRTALATADVEPTAIGSICAHGTGTRANDAMEMAAFAAVFDGPIPTYSIKGALGHTMGTAGLVDALVTLQSLEAQTAPPTANLRAPDEIAEGWVAPEPRPLDRHVAVSTNSGFGGVNYALVISEAHP